MRKGSNASLVKLVALFVVALGVIVALMLSNWGADKKLGDSPAVMADADRGASRPANRRPASAPRVPSSTTESEQPVFLKESNPPAAPTPTPEPADQGMESRRSYLKMSLRDGAESFASFKMEGLEATPDGIKLTDGPGVDGLRKGILESPPMPLEHASNMVAPIWKGANPEGSNTKVEMQVVQGGKASPWYEVELNDEAVSPNYPDGRPNPNYGASVGSPLGFGLELYDKVRYRVTLTAPTGADSPVIEEMNVYHADSTHGEGFAADQPPPERGILEAAINAEN